MFLKVSPTRLSRAVANLETLTQLTHINQGTSAQVTWDNLSPCPGKLRRSTWAKQEWHNPGGKILRFLLLSFPANLWIYSFLLSYHLLISTLPANASSLYEEEFALRFAAPWLSFTGLNGACGHGSGILERPLASAIRAAETALFLRRLPIYPVPPQPHIWAVTTTCWLVSVPPAFLTLPKSPSSNIPRMLGVSAPLLRGFSRWRCWALHCKRGLQRPPGLCAAPGLPAAACYLPSMNSRKAV